MSSFLGPHRTGGRSCFSPRPGDWRRAFGKRHMGTLPPSCLTLKDAGHSGSSNVGGRRVTGMRPGCWWVARVDKEEERRSVCTGGTREEKQQLPVCRVRSPPTDGLVMEDDLGSRPRGSGSPVTGGRGHHSQPHSDDRILEALSTILI